MRAESRYVLDANVFIEAARRYYAFDIAPSFWRALIQKAQEGALVSIDRVKKELDKGNDELQEWARSSFHSWFVSTDNEATLGAYRAIMQWVYSQEQFSEAAKVEFAQGDNADAWLVAYASADNSTVVTHEVFDPGVKRRIPIPNVCRAFGIRHVDTFQMLRQLGVRLG